MSMLLSLTNSMISFETLFGSMENIFNNILYRIFKMIFLGCFLWTVRYLCENFSQNAWVEKRLLLDESAIWLIINKSDTSDRALIVLVILNSGPPCAGN